MSSEFVQLTTFSGHAVLVNLDRVLCISDTDSATNVKFVDGSHMTIQQKAEDIRDISLEQGVEAAQKVADAMEKAYL